MEPNAEEMMQREIAGTKLYEAIGLLETYPLLALHCVKEHVGNADVNALVPPWDDCYADSATILNQLIGHTFRPRSTWKEIDEEHRLYVGDKKLSLWKDVDKNRHEIIKLLLNNGATINQDTVDVALNMMDYWTRNLLSDVAETRELDLDLLDGQRVDIFSEIYTERGYRFQLVGEEANNSYMDIQDSGLHMPYNMEGMNWRSDDEVSGFGPWSDSEDDDY
uniref:Ankyrin repeat protein n=1 Tax=viral metagenome TaxID=1070528 RepID=A0A6C0K998_9ZZZZ